MTAPESHDVEIVHDLLIPMRDGVRLAANLYRPAHSSRVPCLVNYLPYHKDGRGGLGYDGIHRFFARRGYATLVVDFRGLGCSEGVNHTPFDAQEGRDGHDAVEWAAAQPWCDGNVGMWGTSYGGITALKTAAERPPHLKAIVPVNATHDNYTDFLLLGGCRNGFWANGDLGPRMVAYNLTPPLTPDPDGHLARLWTERLERSVPWCLDWYDAHDEAARWSARVIPVDRIMAATLAVCGWWDFYAQGTLDYFARLVGPKKLLMGPWKHALPDLSPSEPAGLLELMLRWWERWLKGQSNGVEGGPPLTLFVQGSNVWRHEAAWPPSRNESRELYLLPGGALASTAALAPGPALPYRHDPTVGLDSVGSDPWTTTVLEPGDHNGDDIRSLDFTTETLGEDWELLGQARALLPICPSVPGLQYVAKLCDVSEDGRSRLVTLGWRPDAPGRAGTTQVVEIPLRPTAYRFPCGHRLRLTFALADFPRLWPTPQPGEVRLEFPADNPPRLLLPRTPPREVLPTVGLPPAAQGVRSSAELESSQSWRISRELVQPAVALESRGMSRYRLRDGGTVTYRHEYTASVATADPAGARIDCCSWVEIQRPSRVVLVKATSVFTDQSVTVDAQVEQDGVTTYRKQWQRHRQEPLLP